MNPRDKLAVLVRDLLMGKKIDVVCFVDELLQLGCALGEIHCDRVGEDQLRFTVAGELPFEIDLDRANGKLRMICARLAVLCAGTPELLYGGEGTIAVDMPADSENGDKSAHQVLVQVQFDNKPGQVWFNLHSGDRSAKVVRESERVRA